MHEPIDIPIDIAELYNLAKQHIEAAAKYSQRPGKRTARGMLVSVAVRNEMTIAANLLIEAHRKSLTH